MFHKCRLLRLKRGKITTKSVTFTEQNIRQKHIAQNLHELIVEFLWKGAQHASDIIWQLINDVPIQEQVKYSQRRED